MFYLALYLMIFIFAIQEYFIKSNIEQNLIDIFFSFTIFILFIVASFRFETGGDWPGYEAIYLGKNNTVLEPGFKLIVGLSRVFGHYQYIFVVTEFIRFGIILYVLKSFKRQKLVFILLYYSIYYFHFDFVIIRQALAVSIFILYFFVPIKKNFLTYCLWILLCSLFHFSSIGLIVFYPLFYKFNIRLLVLISGVSILYYIFDLKWVGLSLKVLLSILPENYIISRLDAYLTVSFLSYKRSLTGRSYFFLINFLIAIYYYIKRPEYISDLNVRGVISFIIIYFGFYEFFIISERVSSFFGLFHIFSLCNIWNIKNTKSHFLLVLMVLMSFGINRLIYFEYTEKAAFNPYQFYFSHTVLNRKSTGQKRLNQTRRITTEIILENNE